MRLTVFFFLLSWACCITAYAQSDTITVKAKSVLNAGDSIAMFYLIPDSLRTNTLLNSALKPGLGNALLQPTWHIKRNLQQNGLARSARARWVIAVIIALLLYTVLVNIFFGSDLKNILQSFYTKNSLKQTDKNAGLINSQAFAALFLLFCFDLGLVLYQLMQYFNVAYAVSGFRLFITISAATGVLIALKFIVLKFIGLVFGIGSAVSEYITVLNLTCFSLAFVFLGVAMCLSLLANTFVPGLLIFSAALTGLIFVWQYVRNSLKIIADFRFRKLYLFIYLCALEICPIVVLIKALSK